MGPFLKYISEVKDKDIKKIGSRINTFIRKETGEPFNDLFDGNSRIVVPIASEEQVDFEDFLNELGLKNIDLKKGIAQKTVETQKGPKDQDVRIGKFIQSHKDKSEKSKDSDAAAEADSYLKWWEKNKDKIGNVDPEKGVSVIISRHPIDILRMSDHKEWSNCHSPKREFFKCAIQEAKTGGAVAYVVRNSDLANVKNLQVKEIFKDKDRKIEGIEPLERVRLRRFTDEKNEYLVPELKTYGTKHVGLYRTVKNWAYNTQKERFKDPNFSEMMLKGGSYIDQASDPSSMWSKLLDKNVEVEAEKEEDKEDANNIDEDDVRRVIAGHPYAHFHVDGSVEVMDGDEEYVSYRGYVQFSFDKSLMAKIPDRINDRRVRDLEQAIRKGDLGFYTIDEINFEVYEKKFNVNIDIRHEEDQGTLESLERFLDEIDSYDGDYEESKGKLEYILWKHGYYNLPLAEVQFENLELEDSNDNGSSPEYKLTALSIDIGRLKGLNPHVFLVGKSDRRIYDMNSKGYKKDLTTAYTQIVDNMLKEGETDHGSELSVKVEVTASDEVEGVESYDPSKAAHEDTSVVYKSGHITANIEISVDSSSEDVIKQLEYFDQKFEQIETRLQNEWAAMVSAHNEERTSNEGGHPSVIKGIEDKFRQYGETLIGKVYVKNGQYWYKNEKQNVDTPAGPLLQKLAVVWPVIKQKMQNIARTIGVYDFLRKYSGSISLKIINNEPIGIWTFEDGGNYLPIDQVYDAISEEMKEYKKRQQ